MNKTQKSMLKDVATIAVGGFIEIVTEIIGDNVMPNTTIIPGAQPYNAGDALGAVEATVLTLVGVYKDKPKLTLLGAGGLAVATPNLLGKAVMSATYSTVPQRFGNGGNGNSLGRYGKGNGGSVALYPTPTGTFYPRR